MSAADDELRARLRTLAEHEPLRTLSASERVAAERAAEASLRLRERTGRSWIALASAFSLVLAGVAYWRVFDEPGQPGSSAEPRAAVAPRCLAFTGRAIEDAELGGRAVFSSAPSSDVEITLSADCDISATLSVGSLYVHAANLEGRALRVLTPHGRVEVRGTVFAVHSADDHFSVEVDEGHVEVFARDGRTLSLLAGQAVRIEARSLARAPAPLPVRNTLRAAIGKMPRSAKRAEPDAGVPPAAESVWRTGSVPTPSIPPEPKTSVTEDGRPMRKPHLTAGD